ncbi:MAG: hypothetical protein ACRC4W_02290 [Treponemataceae bacterium]
MKKIIKCRAFHCERPIMNEEKRPIFVVVEGAKKAMYKQGKEKEVYFCSDKCRNGYLFGKYGFDLYEFQHDGNEKQ